VDRLERVERQRMDLLRRQSAARRSIEAAYGTRTDHRRLRSAQRDLTEALDRELRRVYVREDVDWTCPAFVDTLLSPRMGGKGVDDGGEATAFQPGLQA
jgi:hypothetical protein